MCDDSYIIATLKRPLYYVFDEELSFTFSAPPPHYPHTTIPLRIMPNQKAQAINTKLEAANKNILRLLAKNNVSSDDQGLTRDERIEKALLDLQRSMMKSQARLASN